MHTLIKNILLLKIINIVWQCRVIRDLQFVKYIVSVKHNKRKHNETRYAYQDDSAKICLLGYLRKWVSQVVPIYYTMEKLIYIHICMIVCVSRSVVSNYLQLHGLEPTRFLCPWDSPGKNMEWVAIPYSRGSSWPGIKPGSAALQAGSLPTEPPEKPMISHTQMPHSSFKK